MEVSAAKCQEILDIVKTASAKPMIAYRLHFEPGTLSTIDVVRWEIGTSVYLRCAST
jgi:hypothetical protein